jgi:hypothetical protein
MTNFHISTSMLFISCDQWLSLFSYNPNFSLILIFLGSSATKTFQAMKTSEKGYILMVWR